MTTYLTHNPSHLFRYVDEQVFRYNNRKTKDNPLTDSDRFHLAMSHIGGKRLTGKGVDALHAPTAEAREAEPF